ncbi:hypothetical protein HOO54_20940 [Bacillus sp. WMMC1349]|uniref:hypothetical protein n=1 Tax=Bacillus sp. WMMC1349 TaxID=2736254 RepID=UPI0015579A03|nr:hypothetical protein [Bacillus sp. WMMC1349]NPC94624.1 hypothetical protein [Bacillus sp. WMMC1349]
MLKKRWISLSLVLACTLFITACGKDKFDEATYKKGMPEDSPAFKEFMIHELRSSFDKTLSHQGHSYLMMRGDPDEFFYYKITDKQLQNIYKPIFSVKENYSGKLYDLRQVDLSKKGTVMHDKLGKNLPDITSDKHNVLKVKTANGAKKFKLPFAKEKEIYSFEPEAINKEDMLIQTIVHEKQEDGDVQIYYLFLKQDFSKHQVVEGEKLYGEIESGKLNNYLSVFPKVSEDGSYLKLFDNNFLEKKTNKVRKIKDTDYLSVDGKYVYINGRKEEEKDVMPDGVQKIQTVDNYFKGNHKYKAEFKLDFGNIADKMDINSDTADMADIRYFNENFVVLSVYYNGMFVGTAGSFNVLIDLQKNKNQPTAYLVDLGIS